MFSDPPLRVVLLSSYYVVDAMSDLEKITTTISTKGQVILPQPIRRARHWGAGTRLIVEDIAEGVLLKAAPFFAPARPEAVFGCLRHQGPAKSVEQMDAAITAEAKRRRARD
jgi:AbrB family looped-hinge helix DNA binding protein